MQSLLHEKDLLPRPMSDNLLQAMGAMHCPEAGLLHDNGSTGLLQEGAIHDLLPDSVHLHQKGSLYNVQLHDRNSHEAGSLHNLLYDKAGLHQEGSLCDLHMG